MLKHKTCGPHPKNAEGVGGRITETALLGRAGVLFQREQAGSFKVVSDFQQYVYVRGQLRTLINTKKCLRMVHSL